MNYSTKVLSIWPRTFNSLWENTYASKFYMWWVIVSVLDGFMFCEVSHRYYRNYKSYINLYLALSMHWKVSSCEGGTGSNESNCWCRMDFKRMDAYLDFVAVFLRISLRLFLVRFIMSKISSSRTSLLKYCVHFTF